MQKNIPIWKCRRSLIAVMGLICLTFLGFKCDAEVAGSIATIVIAVAASNASQSIFSNKKEEEGK